MGVFSVSTYNPENDSTLKTRIVSNFPSDHYEVGRGHWLVAFNGTAQELHARLFPTNVAGIVVFGIGGYYGVASRAMWEWLANKLGVKLA